MIYQKEIIEKILSIEDWAEFEAFIKSLYEKNSNVVHIEKNYRAEGLSKRKREVDVFVKFGFSPHIISLGIECKYWSSKVDGDVIDVVAAKKEDLQIDKFAVVTTVGFETGAELYAKAKGIDIFVIRPTTDDDFGYTGRIIKFRMVAQGSRPFDVGFGGTVIAEKGKEKVLSDFILKKVSQMKFSDNKADIDKNLNLYRYTMTSLPNGGAQFTRLDYVKNLALLILETWRAQNENFYSGREYSVSQTIRFKSPTALFVENSIPFLVNEINFKIQYLRNDWEFEFDRGMQHPLVLENVIEKAITPLKVSKEASSTTVTMEKTIPIQETDLAKKPEDAVGRDGVWIKYLYNIPMEIPSVGMNGRFYELAVTSEGVAWKEIN